MVPHATLAGCEPRRLLIVLPSWVGDMVMATPTMRALRTRFANAHIAVLVKPNLADLVAGGDWMDSVLSWKTVTRRGARRVSVIRTARALRAGRYDVAILLPNSFKTALAVFLAGIPRRVGYDRDGRGLLLTDRLQRPRIDGKPIPIPMVDYYGAIAQRVGCTPPGDQLELFTDLASDAAVDRRLSLSGLIHSRPLVLISPGASFGSSKLWLPERFAALGDRLADEFGAAVVITCAPGEEPIARQVAGLMRRPARVFDDPVGTLGEFKALVRRSDLLINNDTGPRHVAKAFGVPVVTIFGSTEPRWTDTSYPLERKVRIDVDCGPCQRKVCPLGHHKCMTGVTVEMVMTACRELLAKRLESAEVEVRT